MFCLPRRAELENSLEEHLKQSVSTNTTDSWILSRNWLFPPDSSLLLGFSTFLFVQDYCQIIEDIFKTDPVFIGAAGKKD